ncbi:hypothetical protein ZEAMMB73_Zm00001d003943 [Zea mays]|uniref:Uncharacterized protein n=1 Tax=Zea mays TaxID=4577 RepID=A0A1D6ECI6_MAIZE|nr:hypothetical protein ZEAMMB73_Zm00001d003943 [Zea mays]
MRAATLAQQPCAPAPAPTPAAMRAAAPDHARSSPPRDGSQWRQKRVPTGKSCAWASLEVDANDRRRAASPSSRMAVVGTARGKGLLRRAWCFLAVLGDTMATAVMARTGEWNGRRGRAVLSTRSEAIIG